MAELIRSSFITLEKCLSYTLQFSKVMNNRVLDSPVQYIDNKDTFMDLRKEVEDNHLIIYVSGRLDNLTSPLLAEEIKHLSDEIQKLTLDFSSLEYMSSAGIRVILTAEKLMKNRNGLVLRHINDAIREILDMTGLISFLTIE